MKYDEDIKKSNDYLNAVIFAMDNLLKLESDSKYKSTIKKQSKLFKDLRYASNDKFNKVSVLYNKKSNKNLKKLEGEFTPAVVYKIEEAMKNADRFEKEDIDKVIDLLRGRTDLSTMIERLSREYKRTRDDIIRYKNANVHEQEAELKRQKEREKHLEELNKPKLTEEERLRKEENAKEYQDKVDKNSSKLLSGPKKGNFIANLQGKDAMLEDMKYLYGFAIDLFVIMDADQHVEIKNTKHGEESRVSDAYIGTIYDKKDKIDMILKAYGVSSVDALLKQYENIYNNYHKKYSKLPIKKQAEYAISNFESFDIKSSLNDGFGVSGSILNAFKNEKLSFPPSKEKLTSYVNSRIMNGHNYTIVHPKENEEIITGEPENFEKYSKTKDYYLNLTKNMSIIEVKDLYKVVTRDMENNFIYSELDAKEIQSYYAVMQKLFCEVIFYKKGLKFSDSKQYDAAISKIAKEDLGEDLKYTLYGYDNLSEEIKHERQENIKAEYIKYRVSLNGKDKKEHLSFREFASLKYSLEHVEEPLNLEEEIKQEQGRRK